VQSKNKNKKQNFQLNMSGGNKKKIIQVTETLTILDDCVTSLSELQQGKSLNHHIFTNGRHVPVNPIVVYQKKKPMGLSLAVDEEDQQKSTEIIIITSPD